MTSPSAYNLQAFCEAMQAYHDMLRVNASLLSEEAEKRGDADLRSLASTTRRILDAMQDDLLAAEVWRNPR
jgi:hypothetical protein